MKNLNRTVILLFSTLLAIPLTGYAESWSCKHDNNVREIQIQRETTAVLPCSVVYRKPTEGIEEQTLWSASSDAGYCEEKARALVEKHVGWGWTCEEANAETSTETSDESQATENSAPEETTPVESTPVESTNEATNATESSAASDSSTTTVPTSQGIPEQQ